MLLNRFDAIVIALLRVRNNGAKVQIILLIHHWVLLARGLSPAEGAEGLPEGGEKERNVTHKKRKTLRKKLLLK